MRHNTEVCFRVLLLRRGTTEGDDDDDDDTLTLEGFDEGSDVGR